MGKISVFVKGASEEDLNNLSKADAFCAEVRSLSNTTACGSDKHTLLIAISR
jgi:hypothetical protein